MQTTINVTKNEFVSQPDIFLPSFKCLIIDRVFCVRVFTFFYN